MRPKVTMSLSDETFGHIIMSKSDILNIFIEFKIMISTKSFKHCLGEKRMLYVTLPRSKHLVPILLKYWKQYWRYLCSIISEHITFHYQIKWGIFQYFWSLRYQAIRTINIWISTLTMSCQLSMTTYGSGDMSPVS